MSIFDFFRKKPASPHRNKPRRSSRLRLEELEPRETPANDILTVTGAAGQSVSMHFVWTARHTGTWSEIGVYTVNDDQGRVGELLPTDQGYAQAALETAQTVFVAGAFEGKKKDLSFTAGTRLAYYMIQGNTLENWQLTNPGNRPRINDQAFFSIDLANRDRFDHVRTFTFGDRSMRLAFEDAFAGGDKDFDDAIITVNYDSQDSSLAIGVAGQSVPTRFTYQSSNSAFRNEVGFFVVDDAVGNIDGISPGEDGYAAAALSPDRRIRLFGPAANPGAVRNFILPGGGFFGLYLVQGSTARAFLRFNPENSLKKPGPLAFFSFEAANPDGVDHLRWLSDKKFAFEDGRNGGDRDFNDFVGTITMRKPANSAPIVSTAIADISVNHTAADRQIDLAGTFFDLDYGNSLVRVNTNHGTFDIELFDRDAPRSVTNWLNYVTDGDFSNVIFHRRANDPFVLQGGGFQFVNNGGVTTLPAIADDPSVANEPDRVNRPNVRGTLAMAKSSTDNATNEFYFNIGDNSTALDNPSNNGGFTVFGRILAAHMSVVDQLAAIPTQAKGGVFNELPMDNYNGSSFPGDVARNNLIVINSISVLRRPEFLNFAVVSNSNPDVVGTTLVHNHLTLDFKKGGVSTITVSATDSVGHVTTETFVVSLSNNAPVAVANTFGAVEDTTLNIPVAQGVLANDTDADSDPLTAVLVTDAANGDVTLNADGSFSYVPNADFNGTDTFTYKANDGIADSNVVTVTINVAAVNDAPVATVDGAAGNEGNETTPSVPVTGNVLGNDTDIDDPSSSFSVTTTGAFVGLHGTLTLNANGAFSYVINDADTAVNALKAGEFLTDTFNYTMSDNHAGDPKTASSTVTITIHGVNDAPLAVANSFSTPLDTQLSVGVPGVLDNDTDAESDALTAVLVADSANGGHAVLNDDGSFTYDPAAGFTGDDTFTYKVNDGTIDSNVITVTITVG